MHQKVDHTFSCVPQSSCLVGRGDFNFSVLECFGELPYDVGYQKKHIRPYGGGWGLLLYPAQLSRGWLNFSSKAKTAFC